MTDARIVVTRPLPGDPAARLREAGFANVHVYPHEDPMTRAELLDVVRGAHAIIATPADVDVNGELFDAAGPQLVIVSNYAVGVDNIDLAEAARRGILVGHTPEATTEPTADIAWLLMLGAARRAHEAGRLARSGAWAGVTPNQLLGHRLVGRTLLIVGAGRIGTATARRATGWSMDVRYVARTVHAEIETAPIHATRVELDEGLGAADFVSVHTPLTDETRHLIDARRLALMKPTAVLVNTARGAVIDEAALVEALKTGRIAAAGLDVYEHEPRMHPALPTLDNAFLLPHIGSATTADRIRMMEMAVDNAVAALRGGTPPWSAPEAVAGRA